MSFLEDLYKFLSEAISQEQLVYFGALAGLLAALGAAYKDTVVHVWRFILEWFKNIRAVFREVQMIPKINEAILSISEKNKQQEDNQVELLDIVNNFVKPTTTVNKKNITELFDKVKFIEQELSLNSGKSLKDLILKISDTSEKISNLVNSLDFEVKRIEARQWNIMINSSDIPMFETDKEGRCLKANRSYLELVGMSLDDVKNYGWVNIIYVDDRKLVQHEWDGAVQDQRTFDLKFKIQNNNTGKVYMLRCIASPVLVLNEMVGYIGRYVNIQEMEQDQKTNLWVVKPR